MPDGAESLDDLLVLAQPVVVGNGWVDAGRWPEVAAAVLAGACPIPSAGRSILAAALIEHKVLTREQAGDLDSILAAQRLFHDFRLEKKLGSGGMGTVYLARHAATGRQVALKTINTRLASDGDFIERFHREARALERLDHPAVAQIIASGEEDGHCWLAMEYIQGPSLMHLLKRHKVLPEAWCLQVMRQIAAGLGYVWTSAGLVHRDLKPENILVMSDDLNGPVTAKLIDFGLVKNNQEDDRLTQTGMTIGTPLYMSPEQVRGEKLDIRSDIYGLGATLYHLLTGVTPFNGSSPGTIMSAHLTEPVPDPGARVPGLRHETRSLVMTSMAKSLQERFYSCDALIAACDTALAQLGDAHPDAPRLLRKPLVIKNPVKRIEERTPAGGTALPPPANPKLADTELLPESGRLPKSPAPVHRPSQSLAPTPAQRPTAAIMRTPAGDTRVLPPSPLPPPAPDKIRTPAPRPVVKPSLDRLSPTPSRPPSEPLAPVTSAAFKPPSQHEGGVGVMPWLVLAGAVLALLVYLLIT